MRPTPYVASLRVYEPIEAFSPENQLRWNSLSLSSNTDKEEAISSLRRLVLAQAPNDRSDGAHIIEKNKQKYVSPWSTLQRSGIALEDFKSSLPSSVISFFIPANIDESLSNLDQEIKPRVPHIISETWMIPPRWFALFSPEERLSGSNADGAFTIIRTEISLAKKRCGEAHAIVRSAFGTGAIEDELAQLLNWLNVFHPLSIVECDYGGLATYLENSFLVENSSRHNSDTSIEDVGLSLQYLSSGDGALAGEAYERLMKRWRTVAMLRQSS
jgi:hypothetical protein